MTFELLMRNDPEMRNSVPKQLQGAEIDFAFESPLRDAVEKIKVGQMSEASQIIATAVQLDPTVAMIMDNKKAARDALSATVPASWLRSESDVDRLVAEQAAQAQSQQLLAMMQQGAEVAKTAAEASSITGVTAPS
jgi:hypothetical protein